MTEWTLKDLPRGSFALCYNYYDIVDITWSYCST